MQFFPTAGELAQIERAKQDEEVLKAAAKGEVLDGYQEIAYKQMTMTDAEYEAWLLEEVYSRNRKPYGWHTVVRKSGPEAVSSRRATELGVRTPLC